MDFAASPAWTMQRPDTFPVRVADALSRNERHVCLVISWSGREGGGRRGRASKGRP